MASHVISLSLYYHLPKSNNNISNIGLGSRFYEDKYKGSHKLPGRREVVNQPSCPPSTCLDYAFEKGSLYFYIKSSGPDISHTVNVHLLSEWMNTWINKMNKSTIEWLNQGTMYHIQKLLLFCRNWISMLSVGCPWLIY